MAEHCSLEGTRGLVNPLRGMATKNKFKPTFKVNGVSIRFPSWYDKERAIDISEKIEDAFSTGNSKEIERYKDLAQNDKSFGYLNAVMKAKGLT